MNQIKKWFSWSLTILIMFILFGVIFIQMDLAVPNAQFFIELSIVVVLSTQMRLYWYSWTEYKVDTEDDPKGIKVAKESYDNLIVDLVEDTAHLEKFLDILNKQNLQNYIENKIGNRTAINLKANRFYMFKLRKQALKQININETFKTDKKLKEFLKDENNKKQYLLLIEEKIGEIRYNNLLSKYTKLGKRKVKKITSLDIMTRCESKIILNVKNYAKQRKTTYQTVTFFSNVLLSTLFAAIAVKEIALNWLNVFRYLAYIFIMLYTVVSTIINAYKAYKDETFDHLSRLQYILDKYKSFKEGKYNG